METPTRRIDVSVEEACRKVREYLHGQIPWKLREHNKDLLRFIDTIEAAHIYEVKDLLEGTGFYASRR